MSVVNILGNGDTAYLYNEHERPDGKLVICNMPPFDVKNVFASVMVDFKMMKALWEGSLNLDMYEWVLGRRPKKWMEMNPTFYIKYSHLIKEFYLDVPSYAVNATNFNCGHMATHYACRRLKATEVHMYGFDSLFEENMRSYTDLFLHSDRSEFNNKRLLGIWRPVWGNLFAEFPKTKFVLHHTHGKSQIILPDNVEIVT